MNLLSVHAFQSLPPCQQTVYEVLKDGFTHSREDLAEKLELELELEEDKNRRFRVLSTHLYYLRKNMRPHGLGVRTIREDGSILYQLARLTASS